MRIATIAGAVRCLIGKVGKPYDLYVDLQTLPIQHGWVLNNITQGSRGDSGVQHAMELNVRCHSSSVDWILSYNQIFVGNGAVSYFRTAIPFFIQLAQHCTCSHTSRLSHTLE